MSRLRIAAVSSPGLVGEPGSKIHGFLKPFGILALCHRRRCGTHWSYDECLLGHMHGGCASDLCIGTCAPKSRIQSVHLGGSHVSCEPGLVLDSVLDSDVPLADRFDPKFSCRHILRCAVLHHLRGHSCGRIRCSCSWCAEAPGQAACKHSETLDASTAFHTAGHRNFHFDGCCRCILCIDSSNASIR